ncbi:hypothetical protein [Puniceibacterium sp. IMCC21224]|uniref:hypothetical protein n=1 Tax=Puniceibacterium sp. IMCC21224 TaxID=1618204 RepID=UPI00065CE3BB|nr:hypothetical protein [Puniceibacterium sp. IMCC21224]KMK65690.1 hypothetical protein IMCC21224_11522 [Puniceibacterium sp. IMCC21224]
MQYELPPVSSTAADQTNAIVSLPAPLDCETQALLRAFLTPIMEKARSWSDLSTLLRIKGYGIAFREGHLVLINADTGTPLCTGATLGVPLRTLAARLGRPCVVAHRDGISGHLA